MARQRFEVGDVVQLKSGGPEMTACGPAASLTKDEVRCCWFNVFNSEQYARQEAEFPAAALRLSRPKEVPDAKS